MAGRGRPRCHLVLRYLSTERLCHSPAPGCAGCSGSVHHNVLSMAAVLLQRNEHITYDGVDSLALPDSYGFLVG